ncbi:MAG: helix-hairpin-helix domain-containing protein [Candidatus Omnitrophica bacterium]|nr:helix-hairpin-helix domain-containing protein [Candidatus Omnitrophota bacterium]
MIAQIFGKLIKKEENSILLEVQGLSYEILIPGSVMSRMDEYKDAQGNIHLITYHYIHNDPSRGVPMLVGFLNEIEKDFFLEFIKVSGIGPRGAVKALSKSISEIVRAIDSGDINFLKTLPGIGLQRAKEIVAKLQGKVAKFGLIQDKIKMPAVSIKETTDFQEEVLSVLLQLQYKRQEALNMIKVALERSTGIQTAEELLNEIYKQRIRKHD